MEVLFESRHAEARSLRDQVIRRLRFATRRLGALAPRAPPPSLPGAQTTSTPGSLRDDDLA